MYKSTTDFCVLILYPASLLYLFVRAHSLCVVSSGFSTCSIISSINRDNFYFFLSDGDAHYFIQLSNCPGSTLWNNAEVKWQEWAFLSSSRSWRESIWRLTIKYNVSDVALKMPFISSRSSLPFQLFLVLFFFFFLTMEGCCVLSNSLCVYWDDHVCSVLHSTDTVHSTDWFSDVKPNLGESSSVMCIILSHMLLDSGCYCFT